MEILSSPAYVRRYPDKLSMQDTQVVEVLALVQAARALSMSNTAFSSPIQADRERPKREQREVLWRVWPNKLLEIRPHHLLPYAVVYWTLCW